MLPNEKAIWDRFLLTTKMKFAWIRYDVKVGTGCPPPWASEELIREALRLIEEDREPPKGAIELAIVKSALSLTMLRIDAVARAEDGYWIFEVKPRAGRSALGQLVSYGWWYHRMHPEHHPLYLACVCAEVDRNLEPIFAERGIRVFVV